MCTIGPTHDNFPSVRFVLLDVCVRKHADVLMDIEIEERPGLASRLVDDEVVEGVMLQENERV